MIYLSTKSKVKINQKSKTEREAYAAWCKKHGLNPDGKQKVKVLKPVYSPVEVTKPFVRETPFIPSRDSGVKGAVACNYKSNVYTGDKMLGIATMHKSNLVPVFAEEAAVEISQMRRG